METRRLARLLATLGALCLLLAVVLQLLGYVVAAVARSDYGVSVYGVSQIVLEVLLGLFILFFGFFASRRSGETRLAGAAILIVLGLAVWFGIGDSLLPLLAGLFAMMAGILLLFSGR